MSLSDPLTLLREFTIAKRKIELDGEHVVFDKTRFMRSAKTAYRAGVTGQGEYYAIDAVWALLNKMESGVAAYTAFCGSHGIQVVAITDRRTLLAYLRGDVSDSKSVDYSKYEAVQPVRLDSAAEMMMDVEPADKRATEADEAAVRAEARREPTAEELEQLETARTAFLRLLEQPIGVPAAGTGETSAAADAAANTTDGGVGAVAPSAAGDDKEGGVTEGGEGARAAGSGGESTSKSDKERLKETLATAKPFIRVDRDKTSAITKREVNLKTRGSILLAPTMDKLPALTLLLDGFVKRNKRVLEEKEKAARKQPRSSSSSAPGSRPTPSGAPPSHHSSAHRSGSASMAGSTPLQRMPSSAGSVAGGARPQAHGSRPTAILVVPAAITSIVNMLNVKDLLERAEFTPAADKKANGAVKEASLQVCHTFDDGLAIDLTVLDNPSKLSPQQWASVAGCFAQGSTWQFKGWPFPNGEVEIFAKMCGFYVRFTDEIPNQKTKGWTVTNLVFSRERTRKHEVGVMMNTFWETLQKFLKVNKPHLLYLPKSR